MNWKVKNSQNAHSRAHMLDQGRVWEGIPSDFAISDPRIRFYGSKTLGYESSNRLWYFIDILDPVNVIFPIYFFSSTFGFYTSWCYTSFSFTFPIYAIIVSKIREYNNTHTHTHTQLEQKVFKCKLSHLLTVHRYCKRQNFLVAC